MKERLLLSRLAVSAVNTSTFKLAFLSAVLVCASGCPGVSEVNETYEIDVGTWDIKIERRFEERIMGETLFTLKSRPSATAKWLEVATFHADDPINIPRNNLKILGPSTAFFYLNRKFSVTTDAGRTWSIWNTYEDIRPACPYAAWIEMVHLSPDGTGNMVVHCPAHDVPDLRLFDTSD